MCTTPNESTPTADNRSRWHCVEASNWLATALDWVNRSAAEALAARNAFHLVLAGGSTPEKLYRALADQQRDWSRWHIWFGDERCLADHDPQRNSRMAALGWLDRVAIPRDNIHAIPAELGATQAAKAYADTLREVGTFDLVLLGLGQDGHTASLFPGHRWGVESDAPDALAVFDAPKPPPQRVTLSARRLSDARCVLFLVTGVDKRPALNNWQTGMSIPAAAIHPDGGTDLLMDTDACPPGEPI